MVAEFFTVFLSPSRKIPVYYLKSGHDRFLAHPFQLINNPMIHHCSLQTELLTASLNKIQYGTIRRNEHIYN
jgi:hypothetical protein